MRGISIIAAIIILLGAGCVSESLTNIEISEGGAPSPDGLITFREGFGKVPGVNPLNPQIGRQAGQIEWNAEIPNIPSEITVIRKRRTLPEPAFLQNMTTAIGIPAGALRLDPVATALKIEWEDDQGYHWIYDGSTARLEFQQNQSVDIQTVSALPIDELIILTAEKFLGDRGIDMTGWGDPALATSWNIWWLNEQRNGYCMTRETIASLRESARNPYMGIQGMEHLTRDTNFCTSPEFPAHQVIRFFVSQDDKAVYDANGEPEKVGEVIIRTDTMTVESGFFYLAKEADRSNYPAMTPQALIEYIRRGGINGIPGDADVNEEVFLSTFHEGLYKHDAYLDGEMRTYFIPAIQAEGIYKTTAGATKEFSMIVPLVREDQYEGL